MACKPRAAKARTPGRCLRCTTQLHKGDKIALLGRKRFCAAHYFQPTITVSHTKPVVRIPVEHPVRAERSGCCRPCRSRIEPGDLIVAGPILRGQQTWMHESCAM